MNIGGEIIKVADMRKLIGLKPREMNIDDRLIVSDTGKRKICIVAESVWGIADLQQKQVTDAINSLSSSPFQKLLPDLIPEWLLFIPALCPNSGSEH